MGVALCLMSAAAFGVLAVFGRLAFDGGVDLDALLLARFGIATAVLLPLAALRGSLRRLAPTQWVVGLLMGAVGYALQSSLYFSAVRHAELSQVGLIFSCYPLLVMLAAMLLRRERATRRRWTALVMSWFGIALVLTAGSVGSFSGIGTAYALAAASVYCAYILIGERVTEKVPPLDLSALVVTGASLTFLVIGLLDGGPHLDVSATAWLWLGLTAMISTVAAIIMFFAGMSRLGPSTAALLGTLEPVVTVTAAGLVFHERLTPVQMLGAALVLCALVVVQGPKRRATAPVAEPLPLAAVVP
jgi:drug/metabolite transporter (DMT)-like permease